MKSTILATTVWFASIAHSLPQGGPPTPVRILPYNWEFDITSLKGPGCPDFAALQKSIETNVDAFTTRTTFGENTVDGSEIYYWFIAYPYLRVELGGVEETWCETEVLYREFKEGLPAVEGDDYRLRLHKNGTKFLGTYGLDESVKATISFTYFDEVTDTLTLNGPAQSTDLQYGTQLDLVGPKNSGVYPLPNCGANKLKFRSEIKIEAGGADGKKGYVASDIVTSKDGEKNYYGTQLGFSYDWQKCTKN